MDSKSERRAIAMAVGVPVGKCGYTDTYSSAEEGVDIRDKPARSCFGVWSPLLVYKNSLVS